MRADRLVAALLFLQTRGRVTVAEVAAELEVSERTARRDLEALGAAGIPVYATRGRGGGWELVGGARTDLTGLTEAEIRALFLVTGPWAASPELRTALRKLVRALPAPLRAGAEAASRAELGDATDWSGGRAALAPAPASASASVVERAVVDGVRLRLGHARPGEPVGVRTVDPLGLVSKAGARYLVAGTDRGLRMFRLDRIASAEPTGEPVDRPEGFDLAVAWRELAGRMEERLGAATVRGRAEPGVEGLLRRLFGSRVRIAPGEGRLSIEVEVDGPSPEVVAAQLAGLGARFEILEPPSARTHLATLAAALTTLYGPPPP
ncbi:WYL domain-containing protein [Streptomyces venezuelae]|uniref:WYL domain-containing protein n=1 Tax=Streptomyces venezuelae TaxID=54571 RepID=A0A5P2D1E7_STRVZ|nr:WYL domain-containing protein [Streptomyces venezuelae]QES48962.1 WYL domain-containing protein [Streptomyces venezuelae]